MASCLDASLRWHDKCETFWTAVSWHTAIQINAQNNNGLTPLHLAAIAGKLECLNALLSHPAIDVQVKDKKGFNAFARAQIAGKKECANALRVLTPKKQDCRIF